MKGIVLAGDTGSKLYPLTLGIPKQLLPIYNKPMIFYPIETLVNAGITELLIITKSEHIQLFKESLELWKNAGVSIEYAVQEKPNGIAEAICIGEKFIGSDGFCLITGDTIIDGDLVTEKIQKAIRTALKSGNATIFIESKTYPDQYGKAIMDKDGKLIKIAGDEDFNFYHSIAGIYVFPNNAINHVKNLTMSERGRLEITELNRQFFEESKLQVRKLDDRCIWLDTNSFDNLLRCAKYMSAKKKI